jgi:hypothetical protein
MAVKRLFELPMEDGSSILVEADEISQPTSHKKAYAVKGESGKVSQTLEESLQGVAPAIERIRQTLNDINNPKMVEVQFGLKIAGEAGAVFSSVSTEAHFTVKLTWENKSLQPHPHRSDTLASLCRFDCKGAGSACSSVALFAALLSVHGSYPDLLMHKTSRLKFRLRAVFHFLKVCSSPVSRNRTLNSSRRPRFCNVRPEFHPWLPGVAPTVT